MESVKLRSNTEIVREIVRVVVGAAPRGSGVEELETQDSATRCSDTHPRRAEAWCRYAYQVLPVHVHKRNTTALCLKNAPSFLSYEFVALRPPSIQFESDCRIFPPVEAIASLL